MSGPVLPALAGPAEADRVVVLRAPAPGWFRRAVADGALVRAGDELGQLEVLGRVVRLTVPAGLRGAIALPPEPGPRRARIAVGHGQALVHLDPRQLAGATTTVVAAGPGQRAGGLVFVAPTSGRLYRRPGPGKPAFVEVGQRVEAGQTVCLIEVMKTFHRVTYGGGDLPDQASVVEILVGDDADVTAGQPLLALASAP